MMKKIIFPNPFGFSLPNIKSIEKMQSNFQFSTDYAKFLEKQNGFIASNFLESVENENYILEIKDTEAEQYFTALYGLDSNDEYYDLEENQEDNIFKNYFFIIGRDPGGNEIVEILNGNKKGWIGTIDHDLFITFESIEEFFEEMELGDFNGMTEDEIDEKLIDDDFGLIWLHAKSMSDFIKNCFIYNGESINIADQL